MDDFFSCDFFFIWIIQLVPINFEFRKKKNKQKTPLKQQQEQHEK